MRRSCLVVFLSFTGVCLGRDAAAQESAPAQAASPCPAVVCVDTVAGARGTQFRVTNAASSAREVTLVLYARGYDVHPASFVTAVLAPGQSRVVATITPQSEASARSLRWRWVTQVLEAEACRGGVCVRRSWTPEAYTVWLENRLSAPVRALPFVEAHPVDTLDLGAGERRILLQRPGNIVPGSFRLSWWGLARPPDTTVSYEPPVAWGRVVSTGLPPMAVAFYSADTSRRAQGTLRQNRYGYRIAVERDAEVRAMRRGVVVVVSDTSRERINPVGRGEAVVVSDSSREGSVSRTVPLSALPDSVQRRIRAIEATGPGRATITTRIPGRPLNHVFVRHDDGTFARYLGLGRGTARVAVGDTVEAGEPIGRVDRSREIDVSVVLPDRWQTTIPVHVRRRGATGRLREGETIDAR